MSFQARQQLELSPLNEVSRCVLTPGAVAAGTTVFVAAAACQCGTQTGTGGVPATFAAGDDLSIYAPAGVAGGLIIFAAPSVVAGTAVIAFQNPTAGSLTPTAASVYTVVASRIPPNLF